MKQINDKYYLDTDSSNYILIEKSVIKKQESKNYGQETFKNIAYYSNLESLYNGIIEKEIKADNDLLLNIEKIIELKKSFKLGVQNEQRNR